MPEADPRASASPGLLHALWAEKKRALGAGLALALPLFSLPVTEAGAASQNPATDEKLPLPHWTMEEGISPLPQDGTSDSPPLGNALLPTDPAFIREMEGADSLFPTEPPKNAFEGFFFFIPKSRPKPKSATPPPLLAAPQRLVEVGAEFLQRCADQAPDDPLFDPGLVLPETRADALRRLLNFHTEEAATRANLLLLGKGQKLPAKFDLIRLASGRLLEGRQCLVVYPLGRPLGSRLFMSHQITATVPAGYLQSLLRACVADALQAMEPEEQLQRFTTQLSIRLIWMERAYPEAFPVETVPRAIPLDSSLQAAPSLLQAPRQTRLTEMSPPSEAIDPPPWQRAQAWWNIHWPKAAWATGGLIIAALVTLGVVRTLRRRRRQTVWLLPEYQPSPRLGAPHCGSGGSWIKYG